MTLQPIAMIIMPSTADFFLNTPNLDVTKVPMCLPNCNALPRPFLPTSTEDILYLKHPGVLVQAQELLTDPFYSGQSKPVFSPSNVHQCHLPGLHLPWDPPLVFLMPKV